MEFSMVKVHMDHNGLNMLTKVFPIDKLNACCYRVGLSNYPILE